MLYAHIFSFSCTLGLMDALAAADGAAVMGRNVGRVVLPSTHIGSPRHMAQLY